MQGISHGSGLADAWERVVTEAAREFGTPCYVCRLQSIVENANQLAAMVPGVTLHQWLAVKAQPVRDVLLAWKNIGYGAEVVSPFELEAALETGYSPERILVNGVGKHAWLGKYELPGLRVHFDSVAEVEALAEHARRYAWQLGVRYHPSIESDPDEHEFEDQFGFNDAELDALVPLLRQLELRITGVHFHLRSNVRSAFAFRKAIDEAMAACRERGIEPEYVDCGGGLPVAEEVALWEDAVSEPFDVAGYASILTDASREYPRLREIWVENGRFITSASAVLVVRVLDIKDRTMSRYIICDGGRTNHAIVSEWQRNTIVTVPSRPGPTRISTVCGPTCMAYDRLARLELPIALQPGDLLVWKNAGAYHIPWETRFSFGTAAVVVVGQDERLRLSRAAESFADWWGMWRKESTQ